MSNNDFDDLLSDEPIDEVPLDIEQIRINIPKYSSTKLAEMIVCDRYFGFGEKISAMCMEELSNRRIAGDHFDFENYIDQANKEMPVLNLGNMDIGAILQQAMGKK